MLERSVKFGVLCSIFVNVCLCLDSPFKFLQLTRKSVELKEKKVYKNEWPYTRPDERRQMCAYAKKEANLAYLDYNYQLEWYDHHVHLVEVMYCPTLPTVYLFKEDYKDYLEITFLKSNIDDIKFDTELIEEADFVQEATSSLPFVNLDQYSRLARLSLEDRRNLCNEARKFVTLVFLDKEVAEAQTYRFTYSTGLTEKRFAISCPTSPELYIHRGNTELEVKLILARNVIDRYKFEVEHPKPLSVRSSGQMEDLHVLDDLNDENRIKLCMLARDFLSLPVKDSDVSKAQWFTFHFSKNRVHRDIALMCPKHPTMYLRWDDRNREIIKIAFIENPYDRFIYTVEIFQFINVLSTEMEEYYQTTLANHPFTALSADERWSFCHAAQNHLPHYIRLHMVSLQFIEPPMMKKFTKWLSIDVHGDAYDIAMHCSASPAMYIRVQKSQGNEIKAIMIALDQDNFDIPKIHPKREYDEEYGEDYYEYYGLKKDG